VLPTSLRALLAIERGDFGGAAELVSRAEARAEAAGIKGSALAVTLLLARARLDLAAEQAERAVTACEAAVAQSSGWTWAVQGVLGLCELARAQLALGRRAAALAALDRARTRARTMADGGKSLAVLQRGLGETVRAPREAPARGDELSPRELEVLGMLAGTLSIREIAGALYISRNTIKTHLRAIYRKLDVPDRASAVRRARELELIP
jgi:ATP/maltotriose-dependent transcriptional regulator MalT